MKKDNCRNMQCMKSWNMAKLDHTGCADIDAHRRVMLGRLVNCHPFMCCPLIRVDNINSLREGVLLDYAV